MRRMLVLAAVTCGFTLSIVSGQNWLCSSIFYFSSEMLGGIVRGVKEIARTAELYP